MSYGCIVQSVIRPAQTLLQKTTLIVNLNIYVLRPVEGVTLTRSRSDNSRSHLVFPPYFLSRVETDWQKFDPVTRKTLKSESDSTLNVIVERFKRSNGRLGELERSTNSVREYYLEYLSIYLSMYVRIHLLYRYRYLYNSVFIHYTMHIKTKTKKPLVTSE